MWVAFVVVVIVALTFVSLPNEISSKYTLTRRHPFCRCTRGCCAARKKKNSNVIQREQKIHFAFCARILQNLCECKLPRNNKETISGATRAFCNCIFTLDYSIRLRLVFFSIAIKKARLHSVLHTSYSSDVNETHHLQVENLLSRCARMNELTARNLYAFNRLAELQMYFKYFLISCIRAWNDATSD